MSLKQNEEYLESRKESLTEALMRKVEETKKLQNTPVTHIAEALNEPTAEEVEEAKDALEDLEREEGEN